MPRRSDTDADLIRVPPHANKADKWGTRIKKSLSFALRTDGIVTNHSPICNRKWRTGKTLDPQKFEERDEEREKESTHGWNKDLDRMPGHNACGGCEESHTG